MNDSRPPKPKRRWYQFRLRTLLITTLVLTFFLSLSVWLSGRNVVWEVVSINEERVGDWKGRLDDGTPVGGPFFVYTATCRAGNRTRTFTLTKRSPFPRHEAGLPLHPGDKFWIVQDSNTGQDADIITLPGGVTIRKVNASD